MIYIDLSFWAVLIWLPAHLPVEESWFLGDPASIMPGVFWVARVVREIARWGMG